MSRVNVDQSSVLLAFVNALRGTVLQDGTVLNEKTCFLSYYPEPIKFPDTTFITVSMGIGRFPEGLQIGGGANQCTEEIDVIVTIWSHHQSNQYGHDSTGLVDATRGLLQIKAKVLRALVASDLSANYPTGSSGVQNFLRELVTVTACEAPEHVRADGGSTYTVLKVHFKVSYDWDLTS